MRRSLVLPRFSVALPALLLALGVSLVVKVGFRLLQSEVPSRAALSATCRAPKSQQKEGEAPGTSSGMASSALAITIFSRQVPAPESGGHDFKQVDFSRETPSFATIRPSSFEAFRPPGPGFEDPSWTPRGPPFILA